ncbi:MAG: serine hydrolase, partial [Clostridia bacterium]|nr:serine hydrolase [Clostridia bacterium]
KIRRIRPCGKQYMYSGGGITLAQLAFERIAGTTLREAFQKEVAEPLGLKRTGYFQPLDEELVKNAAFGGRLGIREDPAHGYHYYPEHAAAGLWTTPAELVKIGLAISRSYRRGGFLKKKTARRMLSPVMGDYGLCIRNLRGDVGYHGGWNEGFLTEWFFSLREDLCVASMINRAAETLDEKHVELSLKLFQTVEERAADAPGKKTLQSFCGRYERPESGDFAVDEVFLRDGKLFARIASEEGGDETCELYPIGKKIFRRKGGFAKIEFGDGYLTVGGTVCRKL